VSLVGTLSPLLLSLCARRYLVPYRSCTTSCAHGRRSTSPTKGDTEPGTRRRKSKNPTTNPSIIASKIRID
jgi:hypothetical protein